MAPSNGADDAQWPQDRLWRVMDVSENRKSSEKLTENIIREHYRECGPISNIFPWISKAHKSHFYVEFQSRAGCDKAREMATPGVHSAGIESDAQHRMRLISLAKSKSSNYRYSPYELRSVSTSRASLSVAAEQGGSASSHHGDQNHPHSSRSNFFYDPNGAWGETSLDNGHQSVTSKVPLIAPFRLTPPMASLQNRPETIDIPVFGEAVKFPANSASTSSGIAALLRSTSGHAMQFESDGMPFLSNPTLPSTQNTPSSRSSELSVEEMLEVLTETRNKKREEQGQDASTSATNTRPPRQFQIHPKFDFREHIMSGRFLKPDGRQDESVNEPSFQLTPLQAYFADIYASLQTELHHTKRRNRQDLLLLEKQRILTEQYKQEAADERNARRRAEQALGASREQCDHIEALASAHKLAAEKSEADLREVKGELDALKDGLDKIGLVWTKAKADKTPP